MEKNKKLTRLNSKVTPLGGGSNPPAQMPETKWINVRGRAEHEAVLKDAALCEDLGLDRIYESMVYLKRWGSWLGE